MVGLLDCAIAVAAQGHESVHDPETAFKREFGMPPARRRDQQVAA